MTFDAAPPAPSARGVRLAVVGAVVLVALLGLAVVLWLSADRRVDDNIAGFARAPSGCDTTLDFERAGSFTLYVETTGQLGTLAGDCDTAESYDRDVDDVPAVQLELRPSGGDPLELTEVDGPAYDTGTYVGVGRVTVEIAAPGDHVITVDNDGGPAFAVAVGGAPDDGVALLRWGAAASAIIAVFAGGALFVVAARRPEPAGEKTAPAEPAWPTSPPGFPAPPPTTGASGPAQPPPIPGQPPLAGSPAPLAPPPAAAPPVLPPTPPSPASNDDAGDRDSGSPWGPPAG